MILEREKNICTVFCKNLMFILYIPVIYCFNYLYIMRRYENVYNSIMSLFDTTSLKEEIKTFNQN